jgi:FKBP-type peptidyl-prolyl cis-trans isomerase
MTTRTMVRAAVAVAMTLMACTAGVARVAEANAAPDSTPAPEAPAATPVPTDNVESAGPTIQSRKDKVSYAFGADLARDLKRKTAEINPDLVLRALSDSLAGRKLIMTDEEVTATLTRFAAEEKQDFQHARTMIAEKNRKAAETFVAQNVKAEGVVTLPSGLQYKVLKKGDGKTPVLEDDVVCNYRGTLIDGTEIDSSYKRNEPSTLPVKGVIAGLAEALQLMPVGSKWQVFVPPALAYGNKIVAGIGPNAMLIFDLELLSIKDKPQIVGKR